MPTVVAVFGASNAEPDSELWTLGHRCGELLAASGCEVATGGYGGLMHAVSAGAASAGGVVHGMTAPLVFPNRSGANPHVTHERPSNTLGTRIADLIESTDAAIALPGSIGTAAELLVAWNYAFVARFAGETPKPIVAVGAPWSDLVPMLATTLDADAGLVTVIDDVDEAVRLVLTRLAPDGLPRRDGA